MGPRRSRKKNKNKPGASAVAQTRYLLRATEQRKAQTPLPAKPQPSTSPSASSALSGASSVKSGVAKKKKRKRNKKRPEGSVRRYFERQWIEETSRGIQTEPDGKDSLNPYSFNGNTNCVNSADRSSASYTSESPPPPPYPYFTELDLAGFPRSPELVSYSVSQSQSRSGSQLQAQEHGRDTSGGESRPSYSAWPPSFLMRPPGFEDLEGTNCSSREGSEVDMDDQRESPRLLSHDDIRDRDISDLGIPIARRPPTPNIPSWAVLPGPPPSHLPPSPPHTAFRHAMGCSLYNYMNYGSAGDVDIGIPIPRAVHFHSVHHVYHHHDGNYTTSPSNHASSSRASIATGSHCAPSCSCRSIRPVPRCVLAAFLAWSSAGETEASNSNHDNHDGNAEAGSAGSTAILSSVASGVIVGLGDTMILEDVVDGIEEGEAEEEEEEFDWGGGRSFW